MKTTLPFLAALAAAALLVTACGSGSTSNGASSNAAAVSAMAASLSSATDASGTLMCTPSQAQVDACASLAAGAACTLTSTAADGTTVTRDGTCRASLDGATVGCAPNPPAPPAALVDACTAKVLGDACTVTEADGDTHTGLCVTARDGATLVCGRAHTPPQVAIDACATAAAGDTCTFSGMMGAAHTGVCSLGPAGTGPLACAPAQAIRPSATAACSGLAAGAACTIGYRHALTGTCVVPAAGGDPVCLAACGALGGPFACGPRGPGGMDGTNGTNGTPGMPGMPGGMPHHG